MDRLASLKFGEEGIIHAVSSKNITVCEIKSYKYGSDKHHNHQCAVHRNTCNHEVMPTHDETLHSMLKHIDSHLHLKTEI